MTKVIHWTKGCQRGGCETDALTAVTCKHCLPAARKRAIELEWNFLRRGEVLSAVEAGLAVDMESFDD